ncbi:N-acetylglucosamine-6-phosphate deacetylase [Spiroplasma tabanidicola]|uniref:N-acetylglucosamine-6-phosphate deacetylase n=1 Tax=Spiroplasma tabanidicola TaxID=324079 RepID=A0A6I6C8X2_9MOLU|nr:N-acetylglucosamine-6-phosphate deacetylase [Spiroplasma tabanidicola]QGS51909.1 N-acetylglucosamine-6-phosphate deacetylase [Spiroplasma tabanidicola]
MIIKNASIILEDKTIKKGWLEIENKKILSINEGETNLEGIDLKGSFLLPGFIDCHVHGGYGVDFESGTIEAYHKFANLVTKEGITTYVQGSVTNSKENNIKYMSAFKKFMKNQDLKSAKCLGIHLEGPFISPAKKGAHELALLEPPNIKTLKELIELSDDNIRIITYAPDLQDGGFTRYLIEHNILPSAGHTNTSVQDFLKDYKLGVRHLTHLFNGMSGVSQQEPGLTTAGLYFDDILCEVITDSIHIQPDTLRLIYKIKGPKGMCIITDAMNAKGLPDGEYKLGNLPVIKEGMKVFLKENKALAGAGATYDHNVRVMLKEIPNLSLNNLIYMTSINIAKQLNIFDKTGNIEVGKFADLTVLNNEYQVEKTFVNGELVYEK